MSLEYHGRKLVKFLNAEVDIQFVFEMALTLEKCEIEFVPVMVDATWPEPDDKPEHEFILDESLSVEERKLVKNLIAKYQPNADDCLEIWDLVAEEMTDKWAHLIKKESLLKMKTIAEEIRRHQNWLKKLIDKIIFTREPLHEIFFLTKEETIGGGPIIGLTFLYAYKSLSLTPSLGKDGVKKRLGYTPPNRLDPFDWRHFIDEIDAYIAYHLFEFLTLPRDPNGRKGRDILRKCKYCNEYFLAKRADRGNQCYKRTCQRAAIRERVTRLRAAKAS